MYQFLVLINISFVNNDKLKLASYLTTGPYTIPWEPTHPGVQNEREANYIYSKLFKENFGNITPPKLFTSNVNDLFTDRMYYSQYSLKYKLPILDTANYTLSFWRNYYMPDYYLFRAKCQNGNLYIQKIGESKHIGGDIKLFIFKGSYSIREMLLNNFGNEMTIPIDTNATEISFAFKETHSWPSGQLSKLIFKVIGDKGYSGSDIPLYTYSLIDKSQVFTVKNLDLIKK